MNYLIFGDVHGEAQTLLGLILRAKGLLGEDAPLTIYSVGDLIDRGENSKRVLDLCIKYGVRLILGNHELWLHQWVTTGKVNSQIPLSPVMGGESTLESYGLNPKTLRSNDALAQALKRAVPQEHREYLKTAVPWDSIEHGGKVYFLSHGGISAKVGKVIFEDPEVQERMDDPRLSNQTCANILFDTLFNTAPEQVFWLGAKKNNVYRLPEGCVQVFGHTPWRGGAEIADHYVALDTGCGTCPPYRLSGLLLHESGGREIISAAK